MPDKEKNSSGKMPFKQWLARPFARLKDRLGYSPARQKRKREDTLPIIKRLRRRLTAVFMALTGIILAGVLGISMTFSVGQSRQSRNETFSAAVSGLTYELVMSGGSMEEILTSAEEYSGLLVVRASRNWEEVEFTPGVEPATPRETLAELAEEAVNADGVNVSQGSNIFSVVTFVWGAGAAEEASDYSEEYDSDVMEGEWEAAYEAVPYPGGWDEYFAATVEGNEILGLDGEVIFGVEVNDDGRTAMLSEDAYIIGPDGQTKHIIEDTEGVAAANGGMMVSISFNTEPDVLSLGPVDVAGTNKDSYRAMSVTVERFAVIESGEYEGYIFPESYQLLVLQDKMADGPSNLFLFGLYALLFVCGILLLWLVSTLLARLVTRPTAESLRRQAEFVAAASHELKSPLTVMRTSLSAARVAGDEAEADKYQSNAESEAERMSRLVEDLLLLAGGDAGSWKLQRESVDMDTLLIELNEQMAPVAKQRGNKLLLRLPDDALGEVRGDWDRIKQIVTVLLDNALQYAPEGTGVVLAARLRKGNIQVDVIDHGEGIPDEQKARVFERFYRADESRTDKTHFGLGLSVAKELAELHGGTLTLRDTEGGGATFRLSLPAAVGPTP